MNISKVLFYASVSIILFTMTACSSTSTQNENNLPLANQGYKGDFSKVTIDFTPDAEGVFDNSSYLDAIIFNTTILDELDSKGLISAKSNYSLDILIDKVNIHSKSTSNYIETLTIPDTISGTLVVKDKNQEIISQYKLSKESHTDKLSAQDYEALYREFAELASNSLLENSVAGSGTSSATNSPNQASNANRSSGKYSFLAIFLGLVGFAAGLGAL